MAHGYPHGGKTKLIKILLCYKNLGGGILLEQSHDINLASALFGELKVKNVILRNTRQLELDVEEIANLTL